MLTGRVFPRVGKKAFDVPETGLNRSVKVCRAGRGRRSAGWGSGVKLG
jgi:hypothetical protein